MNKTTKLPPPIGIRSREDWAPFYPAAPSAPKTMTVENACAAAVSIPAKTRPAGPDKDQPSATVPAGPGWIRHYYADGSSKLERTP